jgi:hypothetical protein
MAKKEDPAESSGVLKEQLRRTFSNFQLGLLGHAVFLNPRRSNDLSIIPAHTPSGLTRCMKTADAVPHCAIGLLGNRAIQPSDSAFPRPDGMGDAAG